MKQETLNKISASEHTKGEWSYGRDSKLERWEIRGTGLVLLQHTFDGDEAQANAQRIVTAVNSYDDMLEALNEVLTDWHSKDSNFHKKEPQHIKTVRAAIEKATNNQ